MWKYINESDDFAQVRFFARAEEELSYVSIDEVVSEDDLIPFGSNIIFSDSKWANDLFDVKNHSKLLSVWMTCLPIPIVLEGCCKGYSRDFLKKSVQKIHSMFWNGILYKNKENKNEDEIKN